MYVIAYIIKEKNYESIRKKSMGRTWGGDTLCYHSSRRYGADGLYEHKGYCGPDIVFDKRADCWANIVSAKHKELDQIRRAGEEDCSKSPCIVELCLHFVPVLRIFYCFLHRRSKKSCTCLYPAGLVSLWAILSHICSVCGDSGSIRAGAGR
jgi:hypothetical protein